jgi:peptide/nickel transport system substrate-binding protein
VWEAIYDGPVDSRNYGYQPVILTDLPGPANGGVGVEAIAVEAGDRVLAASGEVVELVPGMVVEDAAAQRVTFDGTPISMQRMVVTFTLHSDLYWSDGVLLTADDSVYSFELASDPVTPAATSQYVIERTDSYRAVDVRTVVWRGVPGYLDYAYFLNFWHPLPRHAWDHLPPAELPGAEVSAWRPLGWGPFVIQEWVAGDHITAARNPIYFRAPEGLPRVDEVTFRFISDPTVLAEELLAGRCDVVTHEVADAVRAALPNLSQIQSLFTYDARWELVAFGISPAISYERPDFFEDVRVRQAVALCIDRQALAEQVLKLSYAGVNFVHPEAEATPSRTEGSEATPSIEGSAAAPSARVLHTILPPEHPLYADDMVTTWGYAPSAGQTLLATAGWYDQDGDGVREAHSLPGIADGTPFHVAYHTTDDPLRVQVAQLIETQLAECGIQLDVKAVSADELFAPGPEGVLFGRRFDLAQFSWRATSDPLCSMFMSDQVPDTGRWDRPNVVGYLDDEYDAACLSALENPLDSETYAAGQVEVQRILSQRLPVLPLFQRLKFTLARPSHIEGNAASPSVIGLAPDPTQFSELWNVEQLELLYPE